MIFDLVVRRFRWLARIPGLPHLFDALLLAGTLVGWVAGLLPDTSEVPGILTGDLALALHLGAYVLFVGVVLLVLRFVPAERIATRALIVPGVVVGLALGLFTQVFSLFAPLLTHVAAIYGTFVAAFAVLAWLSISFNVLPGPANGVLKRNGSPTLGFSQADINNGLVSYQHDGSATSADGFTFTATDGTNTTGAILFSITIVGGNTASSLTVAPSVSVAQGHSVKLDSGVLKATDPDNNPSQLTYTVQFGDNRLLRDHDAFAHGDMPFRNLEVLLPEHSIHRRKCSGPPLSALRWIKVESFTRSWPYLHRHGRQTPVSLPSLSPYL